MSRELIMRFLRERKEFTNAEFREYCLEHGLRIQTACSWLWRLRSEGLIELVAVNGRIKIFRSKLYEGE